MRDTISKSNLAAIAKALREARQAKRLSQRALSARSGATQAQISRIENGEVDLQVSSLIELARALDLDVVLVPRKDLLAIETVLGARLDGLSEPRRPAYTLDNDEDDEEDA